MVFKSIHIKKEIYTLSVWSSSTIIEVTSLPSLYAVSTEHKLIEPQGFLHKQSKYVCSWQKI